MSEKLPNNTQLSILIQHLAVRLAANMQPLFKLEDEVVAGVDGNVKLEAKAQKTWDEYASEVEVEINYEEFDPLTQLEMIEKLKRLIPRRIQLQQDIITIKSRITQSQPVQTITTKVETTPTLSEVEIKAETIIPIHEEHPNRELIIRIRDHMEVEIEGLTDEKKAEIQGYVDNLSEILRYNFANDYEVPYEKNIVKRFELLVDKTEPYSLFELSHKPTENIVAKMIADSYTDEESMKDMFFIDNLFKLRKNDRFNLDFVHLLNCQNYAINPKIVSSAIFNPKRKNELLRLCASQEFIRIVFLIRAYKSNLNLLVENADRNNTPTEAISNVIELINNYLIPSIRKVNGSSTAKEISKICSYKFLQEFYENYNKKTDGSWTLPRIENVETARLNLIALLERFFTNCIENIAEILQVEDSFWNNLIYQLEVLEPSKIYKSNFGSNLFPTELPPEKYHRKFSYSDKEISDSRTFGLYMKMMATILELAQPKLLELAKKIEAERQTVEVVTENQEPAVETLEEIIEETKPNEMEQIPTKQSALELISVDTRIRLAAELSKMLAISQINGQTSAADIKTFVSENGYDKFILEIIEENPKKSLKTLYYSDKVRDARLVLFMAITDKVVTAFQYDRFEVKKQIWNGLLEVLLLENPTLPELRDFKINQCPLTLFNSSQRDLSFISNNRLFGKMIESTCVLIKLAINKLLESEKDQTEELPIKNDEELNPSLEDDKEEIQEIIIQNQDAQFLYQNREQIISQSGLDSSLVDQAIFWADSKFVRMTQELIELNTVIQIAENDIYNNPELN